MTSKAGLLEEFDSTIAPQKLHLEAIIPGLWKQCYAPPPALAVQPSQKRMPTTSMQGQARNKRLSSDPRVEKMFQDCMTILSKRLLGHKQSLWFRKPVDPVKDGVANYFIYVKKPMDLGTIKSKLQGHKYRTPLEFRDDVNQVWINCFAYNGEGSHARSDGQTCKNVWDRAWKDSGIEEMWKEVQNELETEVVSLPDRVATLNSQLVKAIDAMPWQSRPDGPGQDMSFSEKRRLSQQLSRLYSASQLQAVLDIVSKDPRVSVSTDGEVELDIDVLKSDTLWKLHELVCGKPVAESKPVGGNSSAKPATLSSQEGPPVDKKPMAQVANSVQSSGASDSDSGEHSPHEVKGSTMDEAERPAFVRSGREAGGVEESATNPKEQSLFVKDRAAARKPDVNINTANWNSLTTVEDSADAQPEAGGNDDVWKSFQSMAEQKQQREEQQRLEAEKAEKQRRDEADRQKKEEEERQRKLKEEEERQQAEMQKQREEQKQKELAEIQAKAGTATLMQQGDVLANMPAPAANGLAAVGLEFKNDDDEDMNFDD